MIPLDTSHLFSPNENDSGNYDHYEGDTDSHDTDTHDADTDDITMISTNNHHLPTHSHHLSSREQWHNVIGQHRIQRLFSRAIATQRIAHAYLLWGPRGIGKDALAMELAKILNCSTPAWHGELITACQVCPSCTKAIRLEHPNISLVFSLPAGKATGVAESAPPLMKMNDEQISVIREQLQIKAHNPYHHISIPGATQIRISAMRDVKRTLSLARSIEGKRVIIITDADAMNTEAANTFLKTLEEPSQEAIFILTTSQKERILPTILSRCQSIRCGLLSDDDIVAGLRERFSQSAEHLRAVAQLSEGSFSQALTLMDEDTETLMAEMLNWLRAIVKRHSYQIVLSDITAEFSEKKDRLFIEKLLTTLLYFFRTAYPVALQHRMEPRLSPLSDAERFAVGFAHGEYEEAIAHIEQALRSLSYNANHHLLLIGLSLKIRSCFIQ
jgi:DNA polymerase-3 subunit delta'